jgi:hypothetical protein
MSTEGSQDLKTLARERDERRKTRHRGISFRETAKGRSYYVFFRNRYVKAGSTETEALALQASLRQRQALRLPARRIAAVQPEGGPREATSQSSRRDRRDRASARTQRPSERRHKVGV